MKISAFWLKWLLRFYPPLFFQRIWIVSMAADFRSARVKVNHSLLNRNYNRSIFGGTMFAAADPFYPVLFYELFTRKQYNIIVWSKSADIQFQKPARTAVYGTFNITDEDITEAEEILNTGGKFTKFFPVEFIDADGEVCITVNVEVYIRNLNFIENPA